MRRMKGSSSNGAGVRSLSLLPRQEFGPLSLRELPLPPGKFSVSCVHERLPRRSATPEIYHEATDEFVFVLSGRGAILLDGRRLAVRAGDSLYIPAGAVHGVVSGGSPIEALSIFSPPMDTRHPDVRVVGASGVGADPGKMKAQANEKRNK